MLGDAYTLEYLPLFDEELAEAVRYITYAHEQWLDARRTVGQFIRSERQCSFCPDASDGRASCSVSVWLWKEV